MKLIDGYGDRYSVTKCGNVYSNRLGRFISKNITQGYYFVRLYDGKNKRSVKVHSIVAKTFIENPENKQTINHKDGDKLNNHVNNLEWCTYSENLKHARSIGLCKQIGETHTQSKLTEKEVRQIKELLNTRITQKEIGIMFGVSRRCIGKIKNKKTWSHIE